VIDGYVLPTDVPTIFAEGKQNDVALLAGWNSGDGFLFGEPLTAAKFNAEIKDRYGKWSERFQKAYPASSDDQARLSQIQRNRDNIFAWQAHAWAVAQAKTGKQPAWLYQFDRTPPGRPDLREHGAFHSAEIAYALNTLNTWDRPWEEVDRQISEKMSTAWANFAATGDPNFSIIAGAKQPAKASRTSTPRAPAPLTVEWSKYDPSRNNVMNFSRKGGMKDGEFSELFALLDEYNAVGAPDYSLYKKATLTSGENSLGYRILYPENYDRSKKYPVVLVLHGGGERGEDNEKQLVHGAWLFLKKENRVKFPAIVVFPQCPTNSNWNSASYDRTKTPLELKFD
ncbi:MAG: carboxylesterase family protein, partial [Bacteroidota bacterium]